MKKKIEILGRKVPVIAILMALLVIGTASAAVFWNYATLEGEVVVDAGIYVTDSEDKKVPIGGDGNLTFGSSATFNITNDLTDSGDVQLVKILREWNGTEYVEVEKEDLVYLPIVFSAVNGTNGPVEVTNNENLTIPATDFVVVTVDFSPAPNVEGNYSIAVEVNPI